MIEEAKTQEDTLKDSVMEKLDSLLDTDGEKTVDAGSEEEVEEPIILRQWVSAPGGSSDVRLGETVLDQAGALLKTAVGKPHKAALLVQEKTDEDLAEKLRRELTSSGFLVTRLHMPYGIDALEAKELLPLWSQFREMQLTADDIVLAVGDAYGLSLAAHATNLWTDSVPLAVVTKSIADAIEVVVTPKALSLEGQDRMISSHSAIKYVLCDTDCVPSNLYEDTDEAYRSRAYMVQAAMCDGEQAFQKLWDNSLDLMDKDKEIGFRQAIETLKSRGKLISSSSLAIKNSLGYGETFAHALSSLSGMSFGLALSEGLRFLARLSCALGKMSVDDVILQDELLERLELFEQQVDVDPAAFLSALKEECFLRRGRFMLELPQVIGRVRLSAIDDETLFEHISAWCEHHKNLD